MIIWRPHCEYVAPRSVEANTVNGRQMAQYALMYVRRFEDFRLNDISNTFIAV